MLKKQYQTRQHWSHLGIKTWVITIACHWSTSGAGSLHKKLERFIFYIETRHGDKNNNDLIPDFLKLTFRSQNVRSFNLSTTNDSTLHKILCISKTKADVVFLSDTRLNTEVNKSGLNNLTKNFFFNGYNIYHNSLGPNRGTAILISSKLNTEIINTVGDPLGNFIIIKCKIIDKLMCLGSIYGPNLDENILIYDQIEQTVIEQDCESTILGGEW